MWFKPGVNINSNSSNYYPLVVRDETPNNKEFGLTFMPNSTGFGGQLMFYTYSNATTSFRIYSNTNSWNAGQWYHVAAIIHPTQGMMLFIDGIKQNSTSTHNSPPVASTNPTWVGGWSSTANRYLNGSIDDLVLSDSALYTSNFTPPCKKAKSSSATIGVWNFDNLIFSNIAVDSSLNQNNGIINGPVKILDEVCQLVMIANCLEFDGIDDYVNFGSTVASNFRTIEMWFKPRTNIDATLNHFEPLIARENFPSASQSDEFILAFQASSGANSGTLNFTIFSPSGTRYSIYSNSNQWNANQWYHVAAVIHPLQGMILFIDGVRQSSTTPYIFSPNSSNSPTLLGTRGSLSGKFFNGRIDDVRFSDSAIYSANFTPPCTDVQATRNTMGVWNFNDSSNVLVTVDSTGNNNNGIISGALGVMDTICPPVITSLNTTTNSENGILVFPNPMVMRYTSSLAKTKIQKGRLDYFH